MPPAAARSRTRPSAKTRAVTLPARVPGARRTQIDREELIAAALALIGPHRSVSTLSLREIAREAGIAPNSFYRHFRDVDELAVALIDQAGGTLRMIVREARNRISPDRSVIRTSVEAFMEQLEADKKLLHVLLREGTVGSEAFKQAVERELKTFAEELQEDLVRLSVARKAPMHAPALVAKAMTRLVFTLGATAMDQPPARRREIAEEIVSILRLLAEGARAMAAQTAGR